MRPQRYLLKVYGGYPRPVPHLYRTANYLGLDNLEVQSLRKSFRLYLQTQAFRLGKKKLQESWSSFTVHESIVAHIRTSWLTDHLHTQDWWFDPPELQRALTNGLEKLGTVQQQVNTLELV